MRLVGASFAGRANRLDDENFREVMRQAAALLRGEGLPPDEADEFKMRLLAGFRWILVDEYQDIGADQYALISVLAGRTLTDADDKLSLFAVGDDDQNIYAFNGSSVEFIRRFEEDYGTRPIFLTDNYRSTANIIEAANSVIEPARERMKTGHPIHVDRWREKDSPGGEWSWLDPVVRGQVQVLPAGTTPVTQAQVVVAHLRRLSGLSSAWEWSSCAVVARQWSYLNPVRSPCELEGIPVKMGNEEFSGFWRLRETQAMMGWLRERESTLMASEDLTRWLLVQSPGPWIDLLNEAIDEFALETGGSETSVQHFVEWLAEWGREVRRRQRGVLLTTAHRAKGLEFDHVVVLDGGWDRVGNGEDADAPRRLYYVAMTRARHTLTLARFPGPHRLQDALEEKTSVLRRGEPSGIPPAPAVLSRRYRRLGLRDVVLSFAGYRRSDHPVHRAISKMSPGDPLRLRSASNRWELLDSSGMVVGRLAGGFEMPDGMRCAFANVHAVATWDHESSEPQYQDRLRCDTWEVVVPELVFEPDS